MHQENQENNPFTAVSKVLREKILTMEAKILYNENFRAVEKWEKKIRRLKDFQYSCTNRVGIPIKIPKTFLTEQK